MLIIIIIIIIIIGLTWWDTECAPHTFKGGSITPCLEWIHHKCTQVGGCQYVVYGNPLFGDMKCSVGIWKDFLDFAIKLVHVENTQNWCGRDSQPKQHWVRGEGSWIENLNSSWLGYWHLSHIAHQLLFLGFISSQLSLIDSSLKNQWAVIERFFGELFFTITKMWMQILMLRHQQ